MLRLGLSSPKVACVGRLTSVAPPVPVSGPDVVLSALELDEAWKDANLYSWSAQRVVLAVLDAHGGPLDPAEVVAEVSGRTSWHLLREEDTAKLKRRGSPVAVMEDGRWAIASGVEDSLMRVRMLVRERITVARQRASMRIDPAVIEAKQVEWERKRAANAAELAKLSRALLVTFPPSRPQAAALLDVGEHTLATFVGDELDALRSRLASYDILGGLDVRTQLRALGFDPEQRRLAELGPPQKSKKLNKQGRTLKITTALLVQGSCGIHKPLGEHERLAEYLAKGELTKLRRRLEADAKSLYALYEYGRLHGAVRLRWGFLDEPIPAPWVHRDEPTIYHLKQSALAMDMPLEVVVGSAPGWNEPWSRARLAHVRPDESGWHSWLIDEAGGVIADADVQCARLAVSVH